MFWFVGLQEKLNQATKSTSLDFIACCRPNVSLMLIPPNQNIGEVRGGVILKLQRTLDQAPECQNWRALAAILRRPFQFSEIEVEAFALDIHRNGGSPARRLIQALIARAMLVRDLVEYLDQLRLESVLMDFRSYERIRITQQPGSHVELYEGEVLRLIVEATGFPYPRHQWFRGDDSILGALESTLVIRHVRQEDAGIYCCRLHNSGDVSQVVITQECLVYVHSPRKRPSTPEEYDDEDNLSVDKKYTLPVIVVHPINSYVLNGDTVRLKCVVRGREPMQFKWFKDSRFYAQTQTPDLEIVDALPSHSGRYQCHVENGYGEAVSIPAIVTVDYKPHVLLQQATQQVVYGNVARPHILMQPVSQQVMYGNVARFECQATGPDPLEYQWYQDDIPIQGANFPVLMLRDVQTQALIHCKVSHHDSAVVSNKVFLSISRWPAQNLLQPFTATDKVALLIGNYNYRCEHSLKAPKTDTQILSDIFRSLHFKVVSLLNLTLNEMKAAVSEFSKLLGDGVYAVFYFVGHGFEEKGQCYFVPEDAMTDFSEKDCLSANEVMAAMQQRKPKICTMILDICRKRNKNGSAKLSSENEDSASVIPVPKAGNSCICYATCVGMGAYEIGETGILVKHLQKYLRQPIKIADVFSNMSRDIGTEKMVEGKQIPEYRTDLLQPDRSFCDPIQYHNGWTEQFNLRCMAWQKSHVIPDSQDIDASEELGIVLTLDFQSSFSNVLQIFVSVKEKGQTEECLAWISRLPNTVSVNELPNKVSEGKTKNSIQDIQKLRSDLEITLTVRYRMEGSTTDKMFSIDGINLGLPLVAKLKLWQPQPSREPTEQTEDEDTNSSDTIQCMERHK